MRTAKEVWDKIMPLVQGTKIRYIKNKCKLKYKHEEWFRARNKNIGNIGTIECIFLPDSSEYSSECFYFCRVRNKNLYRIRFDRPIGTYENYYCLREELEIIEVR
jgi:hypothetical protein